MYNKVEPLNFKTLCLVSEKALFLSNGWSPRLLRRKDALRMLSREPSQTEQGCSTCVPLRWCTPEGDWHWEEKMTKANWVMSFMRRNGNLQGSRSYLTIAVAIPATSRFLFTSVRTAFPQIGTTGVHVQSRRASEQVSQDNGGSSSDSHERCTYEYTEKGLKGHFWKRKNNSWLPLLKMSSVIFMLTENSFFCLNAQISKRKSTLNKSLWLFRPSKNNLKIKKAETFS